MDDDSDKYDNEDAMHEVGGHLRLYNRRNGSDFHHKSTLTRGIHITEFPESRVNPTPLLLEESDILLEQYLSPGKLQLLTGADDLKTVQSLDLKVDSRETSLGNFGSLLPNLRELNLSGSHITCMRDLGSSLRNLRVLWMARCGLEELDGISAMSELKELYLEYNEISDVSPLSMLDHLEVLDIEGNNIDDVTQLQYLSLCPTLRKLAIDGNPVCVCPTSAQAQPGYDIRETVRKLLPNLLILDDERLDDETSSSSRHNVFDEDWAYLEELQNEALLLDEHSYQQDEAAETGDRPPTAALRPAAEYRPGSALRPSSGFRPLSSSRRPSTTSGSSSSLVHPGVSVSNRPISSDAVDGIESVSDLTMGSVICGNPSKALRQRKQGKVGSKEDIDKKLGKLFQKGVVLSPSAGADNAFPAAEGEMSNIMEELRAWKLEHDKRMELILKSKEAQILIVDHDDFDEFSDDDVDEEDDDSSIEDDERNHLENMMNKYDYRPPYLMQRQSDDYQQRSITPAANSPEINSNNIHSGTNIPSNSLEKSSCVVAGSTVSFPEPGRYDQSFDIEEDIPDSRDLHSETSSSSLSLSVHQLYKSQSGDFKYLSTEIDRSVHQRTSSRNQGDISLAPLRVASPVPAQIKNRTHCKQTELSSPRQKKLRVGPTGLPLSSQTQQPVIRNNVAVIQSRSGMVQTCRPGVPQANIVLLPSQPRIQRHLPEPPPLVSHPPSNS